MIGLVYCSSDYFFFFFFSSRRRHTRWPRDWSSEVCSSDLALCAHAAALQGDAFFFVFRSARSAAACAQSAQERLAKTSVRVRMGLHTGEALLVDGRYVGMDVHRAARVGAAGHGAQVLLSPATVALLEPESFQLRDLGQHRLKDLSDPI